MTDTASQEQEQEESGQVRIGRRLREERIRQNLTISEVAARLHLSSLRVEDLEQGRMDYMAVLYRRGYISSYARLLGLDPAGMLADLEPDQPPDLREVLPVSRRAWRFDRYLKIATYVLVTTLIVPPLVIIYFQGGSRMVEGDALASTVVDGERPATGPERSLAGRIAHALALEDAEPSTARSGHVAASALPIGAVRPLREVESLNGLAGSMPEGAADALEPDLNQELTLNLVEDTWVEIFAADGKRLEYDLLRAGQHRSYRGLPPFHVLLGRANTVELRLNGESLVFEGQDRGEVVQLKLLADGRVVR